MDLLFVLMEAEAQKWKRQGSFEENIKGAAKTAESIVTSGKGGRGHKA